MEIIPYTADNLTYIVKQYHNNPHGFLHDVLGFRQFDPWQETLLEAIRKGSKRIAIASCNGSGKTHITSAIELWWLLCKPDATVSVCSATYAQLMDAHFRVLRSHIQKSLIPDFYDVKNSSKIRLPDSGDSAFITAIGNNQTRPEAIAGKHHGSLLTVFDEASGIHRSLYESQEGNMTTDGATWICIGNPLQSGTAFHELFSQSDWQTLHINARYCMWTSKEWVERMITTYGEDDDRVRARVFGEFPKGSINTVVSVEDYESAEVRQLGESDAGVVIGLDPSRSGDDSSIISARKGRNLLDIREVTCKRDSVDLADYATRYYREHNGAIIAIDVGGLGGPIADIIRRKLGNGAVAEVNFGARASNPLRYVNKRAEIWEMYAQWLKTASIPRNENLKKDSVNLEGWWTGKGDKFQCESKDDYKTRTRMSSPDWADAVVVGMGIEVYRKPSTNSAESVLNRIRKASGGSTFL